MTNKLSELKEAFGDLVAGVVAECETLSAKNVALAAQLQEAESVIDRLIKGMQPQPPVIVAPQPVTQPMTIPVVPPKVPKVRSEPITLTATCKNCETSFQYTSMSITPYHRVECDSCKGTRQAMLGSLRRGKKSTNGNGAHA